MIKNSPFWPYLTPALIVENVESDGVLLIGSGLDLCAGSWKARNQKNSTISPGVDKKYRGAIIASQSLFKGVSVIGFAVSFRRNEATNINKPGAPIKHRPGFYRNQPMKGPVDRTTRFGRKETGNREALRS